MTPGGENTVPLIVARDLRKHFRHNSHDIVKALDGISLEIGAGVLTALVGPDGAGKTTFIRLVTGLLTPDSGELKVLDVDVAADPQQIQARIGYMPQKFGLYEDLTVQENLDLYADLHGVTVGERRERYPRLMDMTALGPFTNRLAGRLSGGMKQKLGVACTLVRSPELLLLDEPTVGLDPLARKMVWKHVRELNKQTGTTILMTTHDMDEADALCDIVALMHGGKIIVMDTPKNLKAAVGPKATLDDVFILHTGSSLKETGDYQDVKQIRTTISHL